MKNVKTNNGITLIALVVTIIVLLILAAVTIGLVLGQNGIIGKANKAKTITPQKEAEEAIKLVLGEWQIEKYTGTMTLKEFLESKVPNELDSVTGEEAPFEVKKNGYVFEVNYDGTVKLKEGISLNKSRLTLQIIDGNAGSETLIATLNNIEGEVSWTSSNTSVVIVSDGVVTAVGAGETTIKAMCASKDATCIVTVKEVTSISSITLNPTTGEVDEGSTVEITATVNAGATEDVVWASSDNSIATVKPSESNSKIGVVKGISPGGPVTITASNTSGSVTSIYTLTKVNGPQIGDFINYSIGYKDIYMGYAYNASNGWRILNSGIYDENTKTYSNVEIISTGIPAGLYYYAKTITDFTSDGTQGKWAGTPEQRNEYAAKFYANVNSSSNSSQNMYAAAGLYNNFEKLTLKKETQSEAYSNNDYNYGYYTQINEEESENQTGSIFKDINLGNKVTGVRGVTRSDLSGVDTAIGESDTGIFKLSNLLNVKNASMHEVNNNFYDTGYYWLASPDSWYTDSLYRVDCKGVAESNGYYRYHCFGIRPVVMLTGIKLRNIDGVWKMII